jgi:hypothetical protein
LKTHSTLRTVLAVYTIAFTLFLLPMPNTGLLELIIIVTTATTGWTLLYLDNLLTFLSNPKSQLLHLRNSFYWGLIFYIRERWSTYQLIRRRNPAQWHWNHRHTSISFPAPHAPPAKIRLGAWWKSDILKTLKSHSNLRDYILTPQNFSLQKYNPQVPSTPLRKPRAEDDIFSSDEELDTSPLATKFPIPMVGARRTTGVAAESGDSKKTVVDAGVSEREKVSGFISWDALKRDLSGGVGSGEGRVGAGVVRTETEGSGGSWEREALGAAV